MKRTLITSFVIATSMTLLTSCASAQTDTLREAILAGENLQVVKLLKEQGRVNRKYKYDCTPLSIAVAQAKLEVARSLLQAGADPNVVNSFGSSIWFTASTIKDPQAREAMKNLLLDHGCKPDEARQLDKPASKANPTGTPSPASPRPFPQHDEGKDQRQLEFLKKAFESEPQDFNKVNHQGLTWLMRAALDGNVPAAGYFLEKGAHVGVRDFDGKTALDHAHTVTNRPPEVLARLVALLETAAQKPANGAGVVYQPAPRPLNLMTAYKEAQDNPQPLDYFEAIAAFQKFSTLTEYQQMVLGNRAARWLRGNESIAGWAKQLLVANTNSQVHLPLVRMLISAQNNQLLSRQTIAALEQAETDSKKLQIYKQMKP